MIFARGFFRVRDLKIDVVPEGRKFSSRTGFVFEARGRCGVLDAVPGAEGQSPALSGEEWLRWMRAGAALPEAFSAAGPQVLS
jgi:hypothetical protein